MHRLPPFWEMFFLIVGLLVLALVLYWIFTYGGPCTPVFGIEPIDDILTMFCRH
jgi:hypothetical protein